MGRRASAVYKFASAIRAGRRTRAQRCDERPGERDRRQSKLARSYLRLITNYGVAMHTLKFLTLILAVALTQATASVVGTAPEAVVNPLMARELPDVLGKELVMITVDYPPGAVERVHRHDAHAFVYVLQGSIVE